MSICQTLLKWKIVPDLKMNCVMVDQQSGVDLIKQRLGLFKIVWLLDYCSKLNVHLLMLKLKNKGMFLFEKNANVESCLNLQ